eukprot:NODE_580_length_6469_cov_0.200628.p1 type:complete len:511 gc:universal NODE_580_length_6469_cov_0.200628:1744-3276(+)
MRDLFITKNNIVFDRCVEHDIICAIDLGFCIPIDELKKSLERLPITNIKTKSNIKYDFDSGIDMLNARSNVYAKDIVTPESISNRLSTIIPSACKYRGKSDFQRHLPSELQAISCMTYIGSRESGTPFHMDQGGSPGHNIMVYAENDAYSEWYIIDKSLDKLVEEKMVNFANENIMRSEMEISNVDAELASASPAFELDSTIFEQGILSNDSAFIANYKTYLASSVFKFKQTQGLFLFIPNGTMHQVHNYKLSVKIAWNITTARSCKFYYDKLESIYQKQQRAQVYRHSACIMFLLKDFMHRYEQDSVALINEYTNHDVMELYLAMEVMENELFKLFIPLDGLIHRPFSSRLEQGLNLVCDGCRSDIFLYSFHCDCENIKILKSSHQNIAVKQTDGYDYCVHCYANMPEKDMHCSNTLLHCLLPASEAFQGFGTACGYLREVCQSEKHKHMRLVPISPRHEIFAIDEDIHKIKGRPGFEAFKKYKARSRKKRNSTNFTHVESNSKKQKGK